MREVAPNPQETRSHREWGGLVRWGIGWIGISMWRQGRGQEGPHAARIDLEQEHKQREETEAAR